MITQRHPDSVDGARPEHGSLACCEYSLLDPAVDPAAARPQGSGDSPEDTTGAGGTDRRETGMGEQNGQCVILACGHPEDKEEDQGSPER